MKQNYSIEEILTAINDLQNLKKDKLASSEKFIPKKNNSEIPANTLKLIEEAEKTNN